MESIGETREEIERDKIGNNQGSEQRQGGMLPKRARRSFLGRIFGGFGDFFRLLGAFRNFGSFAVEEATREKLREEGN